jgi:hypothetical protein
MPATLAAQRVTVSVETLLDIIVGLISQAVGESNTDRVRLRIAIGASEASLIGKHALQTRRSRSLATFFNAVDQTAERFDLDDDPVYHEATRELAA